jgi:hypothetical protein
MNAARPSTSNFVHAVKLFNAASPLLTEPQPNTGLRLSFAAAKIWRSTGRAASLPQH